MTYNLRKYRRHVLPVLAILFVFLAAGCSSDSSGTSTESKLPLVIISDVHFTPFYDTTIFNDLVNSPVEEWADIFQRSSVTELSSWGQETNYPLLRRALDAASRSIGEGQAVIFPGDILAHNFPETFFELYGEEDREALRSFVYKTVVFFATQYYGFRAHGIKYLKQFVGPVPWLAPLMIPIELIGHLARVLSLSVRLLGNMFADHMVISIFLMLVAPFVPLAFMALGVLVSVVQAFIFSILSVTYFAIAVSEEH